MRLTKCYSKDFIKREMNIVNFNLNFNCNLNFNGSIGRVLAEGAGVRRRARGG